MQTPSLRRQYEPAVLHEQVRPKLVGVHKKVEKRERNRFALHIRSRAHARTRARTHMPEGVDAPFLTKSETRARTHARVKERVENKGLRASVCVCVCVCVCARARRLL